MRMIYLMDFGKKLYGVRVGVRVKIKSIQNISLLIMLVSMIQINNCL
jgi:hypothetical protein